MIRLSVIADLVKYKLSLAVTLSAMTGYFISGMAVTISFILLLIGIFLLSSGAAALNQFTEKISDANMERTMNRPIPGERISAGSALNISVFLLVAGSAFLLNAGITPFLLGLLAVLLYNLVYTGLKKVTLLSVIPGALVGAIPPLIGFTAAGGILPQHEIILFSIFMFLWQLPHFWLILIRFGKEYRKAGFKTFSEGFTGKRIRGLVFIWIILTTSLLALFSARGLIFNRILNLALIVSNLFFILLFYSILFGKDENRSVRASFILINSFSIIVMIFFIANSLMR
jgi:protoheme IX farnesyltransferase